MKLFKNWQVMTLLLLNTGVLSVSGSDLGNISSEASANQQKTGQSQGVASKSPTSVQTELDKAKKAGKAVFVVVTEAGHANTSKATAIAKAANGICKNAVIVHMNREDAANAPLVSQWRLAGAPIPLILVLSSKGQLTGGYLLEEATSEKVAELVPSPKLNQVYESVGSGKPVFLVISKKTYTDRAKILERCKSATTQLQNKATVIEVDLADTKEAGFIKQLNVKSTNASTVMVLNASGQTTGVFEGVVETTQLVLAANKVVRGCGSSCVPGACGPKK